MLGIGGAGSFWMGSSHVVWVLVVHVCTSVGRSLNGNHLTVLLVYARCIAHPIRAGGEGARVRYRLHWYGNKINPTRNLLLFHVGFDYRLHTEHCTLHALVLVLKTSLGWNTLDCSVSLSSLVASGSASSQVPVFRCIVVLGLVTTCVAQDHPMLLRMNNLIMRTFSRNGRSWTVSAQCQGK
jgi:hypothetical protein